VLEVDGPELHQREDASRWGAVWGLWRSFRSHSISTNWSRWSGHVLPGATTQEFLGGDSQPPCSISSSHLPMIRAIREPYGARRHKPATSDDPMLRDGSRCADWAHGRPGNLGRSPHRPQPSSLPPLQAIPCVGQERRVARRLGELLKPQVAPTATRPARIVVGSSAIPSFFEIKESDGCESFSKRIECECFLSLR
jgi:hypothetical protein